MPMVNSVTRTTVEAIVRECFPNHAVTQWREDTAGNVHFYMVHMAHLNGWSRNGYVRVFIYTEQRTHPALLAKILEDAAQVASEASLRKESDDAQAPA